MRHRNCGYGIALAFAGAAQFLAAPASAFELFGFTLFGEKKEDPSAIEVIDPQSYQVRFDVTGGDRDLTRKLEQASAVWTGRDKPASGAAGLVTMARGDYRSLLGLLYAEGYYSGAISIRIDGQEAAARSLTASLPATASVVIVVDPGPPFVFGRTEIVNAGPRRSHGGRFSTDPREQFVPGAPARAGLLSEVADVVVDDWRHAGHPMAEIVDNEIIADHDRSRLDVTLYADPGPAARFGRQTVTGAERVDPEFIRYIADIPEGSAFDPEVMKEAEGRVNRLGAFRGVRVTEGDAVEADGTVPVTIEVVPRKPRRYGLGATLSSLDGVGLEAYWLHRNLFGRAERLRFDAGISGIGAESDAGDYDYSLGVTFTKPGVFDPETSLELGAGISQEVFETYTSRKAEIGAGLTRRFSDRLEGAAGVALSYAEIEDDLGTRDFLTLAFPVEATYDSRDNPLDATQGLFLNLELTPFHNFDQSAWGLRSFTDARAYLSFMDDTAVLAFRAQVGSVVGADVDDLSPDQLFFAGGGGSVRGYEFRSIGVETPAGTVGGRSTVQLSAELRYRFSKSLGIAGFADGALVSAESFPSGDTDFVAGAGLGIRYYTGLGPLRFDVAVPLDNSDAGAGNFGIYIGIGQAF